MALSDSEREKDKKRKNRPIDAVTNVRWSDKQKLDAVKSYMVLGNLSMVARLHSIPRITLQKWKECAWWTELVEELKLQEKIELSAKMKNIVEAAHAVVQNRLEQGDAVLNQKTGEIIYKPVSMKDAHRVAVDLLNQKQVLDKAVGNDAPTEQNTDKLEALASKFAEFATKTIEQKINKQRTIDVPFVEIIGEDHAVYDRGEARLQEGESAVQQSPGNHQETFGTDGSAEAS